MRLGLRSTRPVSQSPWTWNGEPSLSLLAALCRHCSPLGFSLPFHVLKSTHTESGSVTHKRQGAPANPPPPGFRTRCPDSWAGLLLKWVSSPGNLEGTRKTVCPFQAPPSPREPSMCFSETPLHRGGCPGAHLASQEFCPDFGFDPPKGPFPPARPCGYSPGSPGAAQVPGF